MKKDLWHNNVFMALLSIIIIVVIVVLVTSQTSSIDADSAGQAYSIEAQDEQAPSHITKTVTYVDPSEYYIYMH